jgi:hypothetical protein
VSDTKRDALALVVQARDKWAGGDSERALELLNAALERLALGGQSEETMPTTFAHIHKIRGHLIENILLTPEAKA